MSPNLFVVSLLHTHNNHVFYGSLVEMKQYTDINVLLYRNTLIRIVININCAYKILYPNLVL